MVLRAAKAYNQEGSGAVRNHISALKRLAHKHTCSEFQHRGTSLKISWVIHAADILNNIGACVGSGRNLLEFSPEREALVGAIFFLVCFILLYFHLVDHVLVGTSSDGLH